jgi:hypothetical protein
MGLATNGRDRFWIGGSQEHGLGPGSCVIATEMDTTVANVSGSSSVMPLAFDLRVYPNPFNSETQIEFSLSARKRISLKVYDLLGREVTTLQQGWAEAGTHTARFDAVNLPSGVYIYRLIAGSQFLSHKMVLLK